METGAQAAGIDMAQSAMPSGPGDHIDGVPGRYWRRLDDGRLQCPHHLAKFSLVDGTCDSGWVLPPLKRYATLVRDGHVLVPDPLVALD